MAMIRTAEYRLSLQGRAARLNAARHELNSARCGFTKSKHDGYRLMVRRDGARVSCFTRNGHDWADRFPAIVDAALRIKGAIVPDRRRGRDRARRWDVGFSRAAEGCSRKTDVVSRTYSENIDLDQYCLRSKCSDGLCST